MARFSVVKLVLIPILTAVVFYLTGCTAARGNGSSMNNGITTPSGSGSTAGSGSNSGSGAGSGSGGSGSASTTYAAGVGGAGQTAMARFLYGVQVPGGNPVPTSINSDGTLTPAKVNFTTGINENNPPNIAIDPSGTFLYQAAQPGIWGFTIDRTTGSITQMPNTPFAAAQNFDTIAIDQMGKFVYAYGGGQVFAYSIVKGSGQLMPVAGSPFVAAPITQSFGPANRMAVDQTDKFLYLATSTGLIGYTIEPATGALTMIPGSPFGATVKNAYSIVVVASEQLYESPYASTGGIYGYSIDKNTGVLSAINGSPFNASCAGSVNMTSPAEGKFLFAAGCGMFSIDATTGALTKLFPDTTNPPVDWPVFDPSGKFLWIITQDQNCWHCDVGVSAYDVNLNSGAFTPVPNSFFVMQNSMTGAIVSLAITQ